MNKPAKVFASLRKRYLKSSIVQSKYFNVVLVLFLVIAAGLAVTISKQANPYIGNAQVAPTRALYVSPNGADSNNGSSSTTPLKTIQAALNKATPGTEINLAPGKYRETLTTKTNGTAEAPITIKGPETGKDKAGRYKAVLYGKSRIVNINHSYYVFDGFTIDGQEALASKTFPTTLSQVRSFKDSVQGTALDGRLIYIGSADTTKNLTGIVIRNMFLHGAGGECVRIRNAAHHNEVSDSVIQWCGLYGKGNDSSQYKYHNAEGVYIGTSPKSTDQPMYANDTSSFNTIKNNTIYTYGSECLEVKENAHDNTFENNDCRYNDEPYSFLGSNIELRGYKNNIISNTIRGSRSIGLKMKSDSTNYTQGGNTAQNNTFSEISNESIRNDQSSTQGLFCGNTFTGTILVGKSVGTPTAPCPVPTGVPTDTPIPTLTGVPSNTPTPSTGAPSPTSSPTVTPVPTTPPTTTGTVTVKVSKSSDDAEEVISNGKVDTSSSALQMINDSGKNQVVGLRFQKVTVPKGAQITNAYIEFTANYGSSDTTSLLFNGEYTANATTFTTGTKNISNRFKTSASVQWTTIPTWANNGKYKTPNLANIVQEVVNHPNWTSGNAMNFIVNGSGKRVAKSYNGSSSNAPKLVVTYSY